jgi:hypothetical protein
MADELARVIEEGLLIAADLLRVAEQIADWLEGRK